jgi:predicted dehydrogenase
MVNIGIIGYGYWGPNLARNFSSAEGASLRAISDSSLSRLKLAKEAYPNIVSYSSAVDLINDKRVDAVVIATPVSTHYELAKLALECGKHVIVEKPLTSNSFEAIELIELAQTKGLVLMVDHTFLYTGAVRKIKELVSDNALGNLLYFDSTRINLGLFQSDINVLWDLAPHDISILSYMTEQVPLSLNAIGVSHTHNHIENMGYISLQYENGFIAHISCSWTSPVKVRKILIGGNKKMVVYDDIEPTDKVRVYDSSYSVTAKEKNELLVDYRVGDIYIPKLSTREALALMVEDFIFAVKNARTPLSSSTLGLKVVKILEAANKSIVNFGDRVILKDGSWF